MKVLFLNYTYDYGSTGKIVASLFKACKNSGIEPFACYSIGPSSGKNLKKIAGKFLTKWNSLKSHIFGTYGFEDHIATRRIIKYIENVNPDLIHIHNIHFHDVNVKTLSNYLAKKQIRVVYTFHDCWTFTGYCPYYTYNGCDKWKTECNKCPLRKKFSFIFDKSSENHNLKRNSLLKLYPYITAPSKWLEGEIKQSFFKDCQTQVIYNGIDHNVFKPIQSDFRRKYHLENKIIVLGVSFDFDDRKGIKDFFKLSKDLPSNYKIVLVGKLLTKDKLPDNILHIKKTTNQRELAQIYSAADIFVNPTKDEVLGMVNIEAQACGTPVITYNSGGASETVENNLGIKIEKNNYEKLLNELLTWDPNKFNKTKIINSTKKYNKNNFASQYIEIYKKLISKK